MIGLGGDVVQLGTAWATTNVNTTIFRHHGLYTRGKFQFVAFYKDRHTLRIVRRDLLSGSLETFDLIGAYKLDDAHNVISLGCDREGYLHIAYDHHCSPLRYRRALARLDIYAWTDELPMTGSHEGCVTYPCFVGGGEGLLLFFYRDGRPPNGVLRVKEWNEDKKVWSDREKAILSGRSKRTPKTPYWNNPVFSDDGIYLSCVWRNPSAADGRVDNTNIGCITSADLGHSWHSIFGQPLPLPVTPRSVCTAWPVSRGYNLINQTGMAIDGFGRPHIVFYSNDQDGIPQYQHLYFDGSSWRHNWLSLRTEHFALRGRGTLDVAISRPDIVIDRRNRVYVLYRGDLTGNRLTAQRLSPPSYLPSSADAKLLSEDSVGSSEPVIDRSRWKRDEILSMLVQRTEEPGGRELSGEVYSPLSIVDYDLESLWPQPVQAVEIASRLAPIRSELERASDENARAIKWLRQLRVDFEGYSTSIAFRISNAVGCRFAENGRRSARQTFAEFELAERSTLELALNKLYSEQPDAIALGNALIQLCGSFRSLLNSSRWRLGNWAGRTFAAVSFRVKELPAEEQIRDVLTAFTNWGDRIVADRRRTSSGSPDAGMLVVWLEKLDASFDAMLRSRRWRLGNMIGRLFDLARLRSPNLLVADDIRRILKRAHPRRVSSILAPWVRNTIFGRRLRDILTDDFPPGLAQRIVDSEGYSERTSYRLVVGTTSPLVSVIMPTRDRAGVIKYAIQSVIQQRYPTWELLVCDDGSSDDTQKVVESFADPRVHYLKLPQVGGAKARNAGLKQARGSIFAYLDSDNIWHPLFLSVVVSTFQDNSGRSALYCDFIDFNVDEKGRHKILSAERPGFNHERLLDKNFIDLNSFAHRRELYDCFGGFDGRLTRRQDYDLVLKFTWLRDPLHVPCLATLYQRNERLGQITRELAKDTSCVPIIEETVTGYFRHGLPLASRPARRKVTILSWDQCRNHFSKPFALAEALSRDHDVQLVAFRFFEGEIFPPLKNANPSFETVYLPGCQFPGFFDALSDALDAIRGDVIYAVKPRLPSLGLALLANQQRRIPVILESNDLETVVSNPREIDAHRTRAFDAIDASDPELLNPYSDHWSELMDAAAQDLPLLVTHNAELDAHFRHKCLYMRNVKDEEIYDPTRYNRDLVRAELGFRPDDRVILFGGMLRRHKGIFELVELVKRLNDRRYKLLFVGSRPTPDQERLVRAHGNVVRVLPPQDREAMARINLAADLVVLWLNPEVPASRYQMPYKLTDALAMGTPIIANDLSDIGDLGRQGYLKVVPFGDWPRMQAAVREIFSHQRRTATMRAAGRRLFLRQFSYAAARSNFALMLHRADALVPEPLPIAERFAEWFAVFRESTRGNIGMERFHGAGQPDIGAAGAAELRGGVTTGNVRRERSLALAEQTCGPAVTKTVAPVDGGGPSNPREAEPKAGAISVVDVRELESIDYRNPRGIAVVMPCLDMAKGSETARILLRRSGVDCRIFVVIDTLRQGFIKTFNDAAARISTEFVVYLAEDAFPGVDWLTTAHKALEASGKGLLAFNDGKWKGRIASFGLVRTRWAKGLYGGPIFYPGYESHKADNELTVIARATDEFVYAPNATLIELDYGKIFREQLSSDRITFDRRFRLGFDGLVSADRLAPLEREYLTFQYDKPRRKSDDTFVLYRILGNDLYPRHRRGQTLENLQFILDNEPELQRCTKKYILNRLIDTEQERKIIALLEERGAEFLRLSFDAESYRAISFDMEALPSPGFLASTEFEALEDVKRDRAITALYRLKNNYVMNNNGARNAALHDGRGRAKWILPWDGNCFLTRSAWEQILAEVSSVGPNKYYLVPMTRLQSNDALLSGGEIPDPIEEPQIIFHRDANEAFSEAFCYGRRPKVELLWRLGATGIWDRYHDDSWDQKRPRLSREANAVGRAGWVARLASGRPDLEASSEAGLLQRGFARTEAIVSTLRELDADLAGATSKSFTSIGSVTLERELGQQSAPELRPLLTALRSAADQTLGHELGVPRGRSMQPRSELRSVFDGSLILALAWKFFGESKYARHGATFVERHFVDPESIINSHFADHVRSENSASDIEMSDMYYYLDAVRLFDEAGALPEGRLASFQIWLKQHLEDLLKSPRSVSARVAPNIQGTCYDLQVAAIAAFLGEKAVLYDAFLRALSRIPQQFCADGSQLAELKGPATLHSCCFNFQTWINLAVLASRWGVDLWSYRSKDGAGLAQGALWLLRHGGMSWPFRQTGDFDRERFYPIIHMLPPNVAETVHMNLSSSEKYSASPILARAGVRPFWNLATPVLVAPS